MKKFVFSYSALFLISAFSSGMFAQAPTSAWLNEFHYDDKGGDQDQFIEVVVNQGFSDLSNFTVSLYDGGAPGTAGTVYNSENLSNFTQETTQDGLTIYCWLVGMQNGSGGFGDGIALSYNGTLISGQFLSYEGIITGTEGPANGSTSTDIGIEESNRTPEGNSLYLIGSGTQYSNFFWSMGLATMGLVNTYQALPVELTSFTASITESGVMLNWVTATEVNNYGFNIERKKDVEDWKELGFVEGHGNSNSPKEYSFVDNSVVSGIYSYRLKQIDNDGSYEYFDVVSVEFDIPDNFYLSQNYPNPFNPTTNIKYMISNDEKVSLKIYDLLGREVASLVNEYKVAGTYSVEFNGDNLASGVYIYRLVTSEYVSVNRMSLIK